MPIDYIYVQYSRLWHFHDNSKKRIIDFLIIDFDRSSQVNGQKFSITFERFNRTVFMSVKYQVIVFPIIESAIRRWRKQRHLVTVTLRPTNVDIITLHLFFKLWCLNNSSILSLINYILIVYLFVFILLYIIAVEQKVTKWYYDLIFSYFKWSFFELDIYDCIYTY